MASPREEKKPAEERLKDIKDNLEAIEKSSAVNARYGTTFDYEKSEMAIAAANFRANALAEIAEVKVADPAHRVELETACKAMCDKMDLELRQEYKYLKNDPPMTEPTWRQHQSAWEGRLSAAKTELDTAAARLDPAVKPAFDHAINGLMKDVKGSNERDLTSLHRQTGIKVEQNRTLEKAYASVRKDAFEPEAIFRSITRTKTPEELAKEKQQIGGAVFDTTLIVKRLQELQDSKDEIFVSDHEDFKGFTYEITNGNTITMNGGAFDSGKLFNWEPEEYRRGIRGMLALAAQKFGIVPGDEIVISYQNPTETIQDKKALDLILVALQEAQARGYFAELDAKTLAHLEQIRAQDSKFHSFKVTGAMRDTVTEIINLQNQMKDAAILKNRANETSETLTKKVDDALTESKSHEPERIALAQAVDTLQKPPVAASVAGAGPRAANKQEAVNLLEAKDVIKDAADVTKFNTGSTAQKLEVLEKVANDIEARQQAVHRNQDEIVAQMVTLPTLKESYSNQLATPQTASELAEARATMLNAHHQQLAELSKENVKELEDLGMRAQVCKRELNSLAADPALDAKKAEVSNKLDASATAITAMKEPELLKKQQSTFDGVVQIAQTLAQEAAKEVNASRSGPSAS